MTGQQHLAAAVLALAFLAALAIARRLLRTRPSFPRGARSLTALLVLFGITVVCVAALNPGDLS